ncbi:type II secretion system F family protein [Leifsonia sp. Root112D2]|uniref:type II secretion system F family protein n=1 Tax=Leifsonia sp. Root112D2 TaxID=1736426 RepID=UPI0006FD5FE5|nr:type II secretion system F family protein [Leifsonia sp. Root112D2]KQV07611.1 pilus assembly protein [Leifsonia sp. Root112D2]
MSALVAWGVLCGLVLGLGLWSIVGALPRLSRPRLADRVAPYILDVSETAHSFVSRKSVDPLPILGTVLGPLAGALRDTVSRILGGNETVERRLRQARLPTTVEEFRGRQLTWAVLGLVTGILALVAVSPFRSVPPIAQMALPLVAAGCGFALKDWLLQRAAAARTRRIASEFPTVLEFLTLSLSAGEGVLDALRRISRTSSGELAHEFALVVAEVNTGVSLVQALKSVERRIDLAILSRCIDAIAGALEHGSPLAEVLRAQAQDAREESKRALLEIAGKKEVAMMVPLVFLILPVTVLFAIFPGVFVLQAGF